MFKRGATDAHLSDEALLAYADGDATLAPAERNHVAACALCARRAGELRQIRRLLQATAAQATASPREVAENAMHRLRHRHAAIGHVNEFFGVLAALLRGFSTLLSREPAPNDTSRERRKMTTRG